MAIEDFIDTLYKAARPGFKYGSEIEELAYPYRAAEITDQEFEVEPMTTGQGYSSNLRHGVGTSLIRDKLMEMVSPITEIGGEYNPDDPNFLTKTIGNIGATGASVGEELGDIGRYAKSEYEGLGSFLDPDYYKKVFTQPYEDVLANLQGIIYGGYGNTPQQKYQNLLNLYFKNQGIFTPALNKVIKSAEPGMVTTQKNLVDAIQAQPVIEAGQQALGQTPAQVAAQVAASQATQQGNYQAPTMTQQQMVQEAQQTGGTVNPHEATQAAYSSPRPSRPRRGPHGKAHGGVVSLMDLLNRRI